MQRKSAATTQLKCHCRAICTIPIKRQFRNIIKSHQVPSSPINYPIIEPGLMSTMVIIASSSSGAISRPILKLTILAMGWLGWRWKPRQWSCLWWWIVKAHETCHVCLLVILLVDTAIHKKINQWCKVQPPAYLRNTHIYSNHFSSVLLYYHPWRISAV